MSKHSLFSQLSHFLHRMGKKHRLYGLTLLGRSTSELLRIPTDPWPGDFQVAHSILEGSFPFHHQLIPLKECLNHLGRPDHCPNFLLSRLHGFEWLRDLRTVSTNPGRKRARQLITHWINHNHSWATKSWLSPSWRPDIVANRLSNWVAVYDFFGTSADDFFKQAFFKSLMRQYRYLRRIYTSVTDPFQAFTVLKGLISCACTLPRQKGRIPSFVDHLQKVLKSQILPDGGHISRSPALQLIMLRDLIDIRSLLKSVEAEDPTFLQHAISAMAPMVRLFRHGDGGLADFAGDVNPYAVGFDTENISPAIVDMALSLADVRGRPPGRAPYMGYERCMSKSGLILLSTKSSHSEELPLTTNEEPGINILDFEWSVGRQRILKRCDMIIQLTDHSWLRVNDDEGELILKRHSKDGSGYLSADFNQFIRGISYRHQRQLYLSGKEGDFRGHDTFTLSQPAMVAVRFTFSRNVEILSHTTKKIKIKVYPPSTISGKGAPRKIMQTWSFITKGASDALWQHCKETGLPYLMLLTPLVKEKAQTVKWAFHLDENVETAVSF